MSDNENTTSQQADQSPEVLPSGIKRREFVIAGIAATAALGLPKSAKAEEPTCTTTSVAISPCLNPPSDTTFPKPKCISSEGGTVSVDWVVNSGSVDLGSYTGDNIRFLAEASSPNQYLIPAPTLVVNSGDLIHINLENQLPGGDQNPYCDPAPDATERKVFNRPNCFNTTNLHFHGLHVSPLSLDYNGDTVSGGKSSDDDVAFSSDDVLFELEPGDSHEYYVQIPTNHAPGTHWYHPHRHGNTALYVSSGMAGVIIIKEPPGQEICPDATDVLWILQDIVANGINIINDRDIYEQRGSNSGECLVNGEYQPTLTVQSGEIQRWRFVNAGSTPRTLMTLKLYKGEFDSIPPGGDLQEMYLIARDGITFYGKCPQPQTAHVFVPGNRADFLVNLEPGDYTLVKDGYTISGDVYGQSDPTQTVSSNASDNSKQVLAYIKVESTPYSKANAVESQFNSLLTNGIPTTGMPCYLKEFEGDVPQNPKPVDFGAESGERPPSNVPGRGNFTINGIKYGEPPSEANFSVQLNSQEEWILDNTGPSFVTHPFHIHVNPFQVVAIGTKPEAEVQSQVVARGKRKKDHIKDHVVARGTRKKDQIEPKEQECERKIKLNDDDVEWEEVPVADRIWQDTVAVDPNRPLKIQHRFEDYNGTFVLHCHILIHEDQGMMFDVTVNGDGFKPGCKVDLPVYPNCSDPSVSMGCADELPVCPEDC